MIQLTEKIGGGAERDVNLHPHDDRLLIKIPNSRGNENKINDIEYEYYINYITNSDSTSYFSEIFGWEDTDLGRGLLVECIRDNDGRISRTLSELVYEKEILYSDAREKIVLISNILKADGIILRGLHADNILVH